ncbi:protocadherin delta 1 [Paragonimus westermani]|uniref:Protocadherin delta 1 n=1 Tax=Paragonimus westermani TaxID=34504 RepID=A0A5J4NLL5_9TREM|nr:protocadherin delta 1 [Paragonimus westermani]
MMSGYSVREYAYYMVFILYALLLTVQLTLTERNKNSQLIHPTTILNPIELEQSSTRLFKITEESANGTAIHGVAEHLRRSAQISVQPHESFEEQTALVTYQLLGSLDSLTNALHLDPDTGQLTVCNRIDREAVCPKQTVKYSTIGSSSKMNIENVLDYHHSSGLTTSLDDCVRQLEILATANNEIRKIMIRLQIEDINDNSPQWSEFQSSAPNGVENKGGGNKNAVEQLPLIEVQMLETAKSLSKSHITQTPRISLPLAYDPDAGENGRVKYDLTTPPPGSSDALDDSSHRTPAIALFRLESFAVDQLDLVATSDLDFEQKQKYSLYLLASDYGTPARTSTALLHINLIDVNDEEPVFEREVFYPVSGAISEKTVPGTVILNLSATDADASPANSHLRYAMMPDSIASKYFTVHTDGRVSLRQWIDYESIDSTRSNIQTHYKIEDRRKQFVFQVQAIDSAPPPYEKQGEALVIIPVIDENDEAPVITPQFFGPSELTNHGVMGVVTENSPVPVRLAYIQVRDPDFHGTDQVSCHLLDNVNFSLTPVKSTAIMDFDMPQVTDSEGSRNDFILSLVMPVDRERTPHLHVRIKCVDQAGNTNERTMRIRVADVNDEVPKFTQTIYRFQLPENTEPGRSETLRDANGSVIPQWGHRIGRLVANDKDVGDNARIVYRLAPDSLEIVPAAALPLLIEATGETVSNFQYDPTVHHRIAVSKLFRLDEDSGVLHALKSFDAENVVLFRFKALAVDHPTGPGSRSLTGTTDVEVRIADTNDWAPIFYKVNQTLEEEPKFTQRSLQVPIELVTQYVFHVKENRPAYYFVGRIAAMDPDAWYHDVREQAENPKSPPHSHTSSINLRIGSDADVDVRKTFSLHMTGGTLRILHPLDREQKAVYVFHVIATDNGGNSALDRTATATVTVFVEDENDNDPVFIRPVASPNRSSNPIANTAGMGSTSAQRELVSGSNSHFNASTETDGRTRIGVWHQENGVTASMENIPIVGVHQKAWAQLPHKDGDSTVGGRPLLRLEATDADTGENGRITYRIGSGNTDRLFQLDSVTGTLMLAPVLQSHSDQPVQPTQQDAGSRLGTADELRGMTGKQTHINYLLRFEACDNGIPKRCALPIWVRMALDMNDLPQLLAKTQLTGQLTHELPRGLIQKHQSAQAGSPLFNRRGSHGPESRVNGLSGSPSEVNQLKEAGHPGNGQWPVFFNLNEVGPKQSGLSYGSAARPGAYNWQPLSSNHNRQLLLQGEGAPIPDFAQSPNLVVSEAVIICLVVVFVVLLCAASVLLYLVRRKAILYTITTRGKLKGPRTSNMRTVEGKLVSYHTSQACEPLEMAESTSVYQMVPRSIQCGPVSTTAETVTTKLTSTDAVGADTMSLQSMIRRNSEPLLDSQITNSRMASLTESVYLSQALLPPDYYQQRFHINSQSLMRKSTNTKPGTLCRPIPLSATTSWELASCSGFQGGMQPNPVEMVGREQWNSQSYLSTPPPVYHATSPSHISRISSAGPLTNERYGQDGLDPTAGFVCVSQTSNQVPHYHRDLSPVFTDAPESTALYDTSRVQPNSIDGDKIHAYHDRNALSATLRRHNYHLNVLSTGMPENRPSVYSLIQPTQYFVSPRALHNNHTSNRVNKLNNGQLRARREKFTNMCSNPNDCERINDPPITSSGEKLVHSMGASSFDCIQEDFHLHSTHSPTHREQINPVQNPILLEDFQDFGSNDPASLSPPATQSSLLLPLIPKTIGGVTSSGHQTQSMHRAKSTLISSPRGLGNKYVYEAYREASFV